MRRVFVIVLMVGTCLSASSSDFRFKRFKKAIDTYSGDNEALTVVGGPGDPPDPPAQGPDMTAYNDVRQAPDGVLELFFGNEFEFGFEMKVEEIPYTPDIKRKVQTWVYVEWWDGGGEVRTSDFSPPNQSFPSKGTPPNGWDPDDDRDEDLTPSVSDMIYSMDAPGVGSLYVPSGYEADDKVRFCYRFYEWVEPDGGDGEPYTGDDESPVVKWSYVFRAVVTLHPQVQDLYLAPDGHLARTQHIHYPEATSWDQ